MAKEAVAAPRIFVSYSWSSPSHEQWVVQLAERLRGDGVDVILDKWDLKEGQDKYAFMESMVTDESVVKVLAICDARYAQKADGREGGVGTETQIISKEVYEKVKQTKFIPILAVFDSEGKPCLPTFFGGRVYIDMSTPERLNENYPKLVRSIFGKPLYEKPVLGSPPSYVTEESLIPSRTAGKFAMVKDALVRGKTDLLGGFIADYLDAFLASLEDLKTGPPTSQEPSFDEKVVSSIRSSLPRRDEFIEFLDVFTRFADDDKLYTEIREMYQGFLRLLERPAGGVWWPTQVDIFRFIGYELFLYLAAILIKNRRYAKLDIFAERPYFYYPSAGPSAGKGAFAGYSIFCSPIESLDKVRSSRLGRMSVAADLIKERAYRRDLNLDSLMQADLVLFLRWALHPRHSERFWNPRTLIFAEYYESFELFAKATSRPYFSRLAMLLKIESKDELVQMCNTAEARGEPVLGRFPLSVDPMALINLENLDTQP